MPDWFYRTVSRPLLFALPAEASRDFALGFLAVLCRLPLGAEVIDLLGHMRADDRLARTVAGVTFPSPVGIGCGLDARAVALPALARFGVGFLEVGPVTLTGSASAPLERDAARQAVLHGGPPASLPLEDAVEKLEEARGAVPLVVRFRPAASILAEQAAAECAPGGETGARGGRAGPGMAGRPW